jgi:hypothetical protein
VVYSGAQNSFQVSWPNDHIGWQLLMNTNGLSNPTWVAVPNSATTNQVSIPLGLGQGVFFELVYP